jgi:hypothetical protein
MAVAASCQAPSPRKRLEVARRAPLGKNILAAALAPILDARHPV